MISSAARVRAEGRAPALAERRVPRCANCDGEIMRADLTMQGPRGPWIHEATRTRMCRGEFTAPRFAEPIVGPAVSESPATAALTPERDAEISERMAELAVTDGEPRFVWAKRLHTVHLSIEDTFPRWEKCALCFAQARAVVEGLDR